MNFDFQVGDAIAVFTAQAVAGTEVDASVIDNMKAGKSGLLIDVTYVGDNATDDLLLYVRRRITDATFVGTEIVKKTFRIPASATSKIYSCEIMPEDMGPGYTLLSLIRDGSATTFTVTMVARKFRKTTEVA